MEPQAERALPALLMLGYYITLFWGIGVPYLGESLMAYEDEWGWRKLVREAGEAGQLFILGSDRLWRRPGIPVYQQQGQYHDAIWVGTILSA